MSNWFNIRVGSIVRERDGRHEGRVVALFGGVLPDLNKWAGSAEANVIWDNGWRSHRLKVEELEVLG